MKRRVYISGPIAKNPTAEEDFAQAALYVDSFRDLEAVNPFDVPPVNHDGHPCPRAGYFPGPDARDHTSSCCFMRTDLAALLTCDEILMLEGWEHSKGALVENTVAEAIGLPVSYYRQAAS